MFVGFGCAMLLPILFWLFHFPDPKFWRLPIDAQLVLTATFFVDSVFSQIHASLALSFPAKIVIQTLFSPISSLVDQIYLGFLFDWLLQCTALTFNFYMIIVSGSLFIGLVLYIPAMSADIKVQLTLLDNSQTKAVNSTDRLRALLVYAKEVRFHIEIQKYAFSQPQRDSTITVKALLSDITTMLLSLPFPVDWARMCVTSGMKSLSSPCSLVAPVWRSTYSLWRRANRSALRQLWP